MAMKIRLARGGSKKRPFYRIVAADSRMPRDGRYIEKLGTYNPLLPKDSEERVFNIGSAKARNPPIVSVGCLKLLALLLKKSELI